MADPNSPVTRFTLWRAMLPPALRILLTVNIATYLLYVVMSIVGVGEWLRVLALPLVPAQILRQPWTVLTYGVTNVYPGFFGLISFAFGAYWLNWLGREYEQEEGSAGLLGLYVFGTLGGALLAAVLGAFVSGDAVQTAWIGTWFGVWGPALAVLCATAALHPEPPDRAVPPGCDLAQVDRDCLRRAGVGLLEGPDAPGRGALRRDLRPGRPARRRPGRVGPADLRRAPLAPGAQGRARVGLSRASPPRAASASREPEARGGSRSGTKDVDAILDKILEKGYDSLTRDEREALDRASRD